MNTLSLYVSYQKCTYPMGKRSMRLFISLMLLILVSVFAQAKEVIIKSHGISTFGVLKYEADFKQLDYVNPNAPKGGEYSTWSFGTFDSLNPYILKGNAGTLSSIFFESLMVSTQDEPDAMYALIAESIEYPKNRQWAIFNIRSTAQFSDNTPITAEDVVFSFNLLVEKGRPSYKVLLRDFEKVEALTSHRVKFTFKKDANTRELPQIAAGLPVFSKAYYTKHDFTQSTLDAPVGSGPYGLDKVVAGKTISYKRDPNYWGKDLPINVGRFNFDKITIEYYTDYTSAFEGFKGGTYNYREEYSSKVWATSYNFPALKEGHVIKEQIPDNRPSGVQGFWFNLRREKFKDPRVREAFGLVFNFEWSNKTLFYNLYQRTDSFWENSYLQAEGIPDDEELKLLTPLRAHLPKSVFHQPVFSPAVSKPKKLDRTTFKKAQKLLKEAGWKVVNGTLQNAEGESFEAKILNDSPSFERIINPYIENLKKLGIIASLEKVDNAQQAEREKKFDFDIVTRRYIMSLTPGLELRNIFSSATANLPSSNNIMGLENPAIDALINHIEQASSREALDVAVKALDRALRALHIWVPHWYNPFHNIAYFDVFGRPEKLPLFAIGALDCWWYDSKKAARLKAAGVL